MELSLLTRFCIFLMMVLLVPRGCQRLGLPPVVGFVLVGVVLGPNALQVAPANREVANFLAEIGKLLLMFFAGLEVNFQQFVRTGHRSLLFGLLTFLLPLLTGIGVGTAFGYPLLSAVVIGSLLASHTLLAFPIIKRLNLVERESVAVTVGATVFTDIGALLILAICIPIHTAGFSWHALQWQLLQLAIYVPLVLVGFAALGKRFLRRGKGEAENQFLLALLIMTLASEAAEWIQLEPIVGAFLAGLAVNRALKRTKGAHELEFIGYTMFIPMFFIVTGYLIDVEKFASTLMNNTGLVAGIVFGLIGSKLLAGMLTQRIFGYSNADGVLIGALSLPQVAATLAAAIVAFQTVNAAGERLIDQRMVDVVLVLMLVTSVIGPILVEQVGKRLSRS